MGHDDLPIPTIRIGDSAEVKRAAYAELLSAAQAILQSDDGNGSTTSAAAIDAVAALSTVAFLLSRALPHCSWSGFYRRVPQTEPPLLVVGPYVGRSMGCLLIPFSRGVCGAAARERRSQVVPDVSRFPGHIACASTTRSELVVPVFERGDAQTGAVVAVLDLDSDEPAAFDGEDDRGLEALCAWLGRTFFSSSSLGGRS